MRDERKVSGETRRVKEKKTECPMGREEAHHVLPGTLPSLFAVFAPFAVENTTDTPFKFYEPRTTRTARTRASSSFTALGPLFRGEGKPSPWTLP